MNRQLLVYPSNGYAIKPPASSRNPSAEYR